MSIIVPKAFQYGRSKGTNLMHAWDSHRLVQYSVHAEVQKYVYIRVIKCHCDFAITSKKKFLLRINNVASEVFGQLKIYD